MQPQYPQAQYNNFSPALLEARTRWERALGIAPDEMLVFRLIGTGDTSPLQIKYLDKASENSNFEEMKPAPKSFCVPNQESIVDKAAQGGFVQLVYFEGGYAPGKIKSPVAFSGADETVIKVVPAENPDLYDFLTFSPRLKDGPLPSRKAPQYALLRPDLTVAGNWADDQRQAGVILAIGAATADVLKYLAPKVGLPADTSTDERMRRNYADFAKARPANAARLEALFAADETKVYQHVERAIAADVVQVNRDKSLWVLSATQDAITPASPDRNTLDQLVSFLIQEPGQTTYKQINGLTEKATTAKRK